MLVRGIAQVARMVRDHDVPVLVTQYQDDPFAEPVANASDRTLRYEDTEYGPRFVGDEFETLVYPQGDGTVQTTLAFWKRVLRQRAAAPQTEGITRSSMTIGFDRS